MVNEWKDKNDLIDILEKRNLIIDDATLLDDVNYSHLIYLYSDLFYVDKINKIYAIGTKVSDIFLLFKFNKEISKIIYDFSHYMEHKIRSIMANVISESNPIGYFERTFYDKGNIQSLSYYGDGSEFNGLLSNLSDINDLHKSKYNNDELINGIVPFWRIIDHLSIGTLSMNLKYHYSGNSIFKKLNMHFSDLSCIKKYRNATFHANKIMPRYRVNTGKGHYYIQIRTLIKIMKNHKGRDDVDFYTQVEGLFASYFVKNPSISHLETQIRKDYGVK